MELFTLENGLKVCLKEREDLFSTTVVLWVKAGAAYETDRERGAAHFLEHVIFTESENLAPGQIDAEVERLGGELNAATSYDYTYYYINLPGRYTLRALELISELVLRPVISERAVEKERPIVLEEIARSRDNPHELFSERFLMELYRKAPYRHPILGYPDTVSSFTPELLQSFYNRLYTPERMGLVVVGNFRPEEVKSRLSGLFCAEKKGEPVTEPEPEPADTAAARFALSHPTVSFPYVALGWKLPPCGRHDIYFEILDSMLSSGRSALLYRELRERGVVFSASSNYQNLLFGSNFTVSMATENPERAVEELKKLLKNLVERVSESEFQLAKEKLKKGELFGRESGEAEADAIGYAVTVLGDPGYFTDFFKDLEAADINTFREKISFLTEEPLIGLLTPQAD